MREPPEVELGASGGPAISVGGRAETESFARQFVPECQVSCLPDSKVPVRESSTMGAGLTPAHDHLGVLTTAPEALSLSAG
jgi:hypothetical protein